MRRIVALAALLLLVLSFGCVQGQEGELEDAKAQAESLNASLEDCNDNLAALQAQYDALSNGSAGTQQQVNSLQSQVSDLTDTVSSLQSELSEEGDKTALALRQANLIHGKLLVYERYDEIFVQASTTPSTSQLVDMEVRVRGLNDSEVLEKWTAVLDCGYCAEAAELESEFVAQLLKSIGNNVEDIQSELE